MTDKTTKPGEFTDEELANLSPEEREALKAGDEEERASLKDIAGDDDDDGTGDGDDEDKDKDKDEDSDAGDGEDADGAKKGDGDGADESAGDGEGAGEGKGEGKDKPAKTATASSGEDEDDDHVTEYSFSKVEGYDEKMTALSGERAAVRQKFDDGELTSAEMMAELDKINDKRDVLRDQQNKAALAEELSEQNVKGAWERAQQRFYGAHPEYSQDEILFSALNMAVKKVAAAAKVANEDIGFGEVMRRAHTEVSKRFKASQPAADADGDGGADGAGKDKDTKADAGKDKKPASKPLRKPDLKAVPKTLGNLPAAGGGDDGDGGNGEFAHIDKLEGMDLENALARLTPDQEARYLRASSGKG